jgi:D-aminoacyl-tRNA deacylase
MKVLLQRVNHARVDVDSKTVGSISQGLLLLVGFGTDDTEQKLRPLAEKVVNLRVFASEKSHFDLSLLDIKGGVLAVPQFTLYADTTKGRRPDFTRALEPENASRLFTQFVSFISALGVKEVAAGVFGAHMQLLFENDGPLTIMLEI